MFLAVRDLRFARGRFALMGIVVALITFMVVLLSGLTDGLGHQSTSAITSLPVNQIAVGSDGGKLSFASSQVPESAVGRARALAGVSSVGELTIRNGRAAVAGKDEPVALFGIRPGAPGAPAQLAAGSVVVGSDLGAQVGDTLTLGTAQLKIAAVSKQASYSHLPVVWVAPQALSALGGQEGSAPTALLLNTSTGFSPSDFSKATGLQLMTPAGAVNAIGSYSSEHGSLFLMKVLLLLISALVIGAFFTVWTVQRTPDLAVLKAMGASTGYLVRDALAQAAVLLVLGGVIGTLLAAGVALAVSGAVPMVVSAATTVSPSLMLLAVGLVGAVASLRRIATVDPITALGSAR